MHGLKEEVRCDVKLMRPNSLKELMNFAGQVEDRNEVRDRLQDKRQQESQTGPRK